MADEQNPTTRVRITNNTDGPRYVHGLDGPVTVAKGATSGYVEVRNAELAAMPEGMVADDTPEAQADDANAPGKRDADTGGAAEGVGMVIPDDLRSDRSADGIVGRDKLVEIAKAEGVEFETDANKTTLVNAIAEKRGASE